MKEKSEFEKRTAEKQVSLLTEALTSAVDAKGHWLNASGKLYPKLSGAKKTAAEFEKQIAARNLNISVDTTGCVGTCYLEPIPASPPRRF